MSSAGCIGARAAAWDQAGATGVTANMAAILHVPYDHFIFSLFGIKLRLYTEIT